MHTCKPYDKEKHTYYPLRPTAVVVFHLPLVMLPYVLFPDNETFWKIARLYIGVGIPMIEAVFLVLWWPIGKLLKQRDRDHYSNQTDFSYRFNKHIVWFLLVYFLPCAVVGITGNKWLSDAAMIFQSVLNILIFSIALHPYGVKVVSEEMNDELNSNADLMLAKVREYVEGNALYQNPHISMNQICEGMKIGQTEMQQLFRKLGGFYDYINRLRLVYALEYEQQHPNDSRERVAAEAGFEILDNYEEAKQRYKDSREFQLAIRINKWIKEEGYVEPSVTLESLAQKLGSNRTYVARYFSQIKHVNFRDWLINERLEKSKRLMRERPGLNMSEVAIRSGFPSGSAFTHAFSRVEGMSPGEWKSQS